MTSIRHIVFLFRNRTGDTIIRRLARSIAEKKDLCQLRWLSPHNLLFCIASDRLSKNAAQITNKSISFPNYPSKSWAPSLCPHCKNFPKRYAWLSVTFVGFTSFEQVTGNNGFRPWNSSHFRNLVNLGEWKYCFSRSFIFLELFLLNNTEMLRLHT